MERHDIDIAIIGGGVIGCAVARELSQRKGSIFLFEKHAAVTKGENQSSRNSGVIHSGIYYDQKTRPEKAALCVEGNRLLYDFCTDHRVPALNTGKLIVATNRHEDGILEQYLFRAQENGVPGVRRISGKTVARREPNVVAISALDVPSAGIVDAPSLVYRLSAIAASNGVELMTASQVVAMKSDGDTIQLTVSYRDGKTDSIRTRIVINAAGVDADEVGRLINPDLPYERDPIKGESYKFYGHKRPELQVMGTNIYPTPERVVTELGSHFTVGVHLTPTFKDLSYPPQLGTTVTVGPKVVPMFDHQGKKAARLDAGIFAQQARRFFPGIREDDLSWHQAGVQARLKNHPDFVIQQDPACAGVIHLLGIDSPGLTASLAIGRRVAQMIHGMGGV